MKSDIRIRYRGASYVELPAPVSVKNESGARKWIGGAFNRAQRKTFKGGIKSSSVQSFNVNGNVLVTNSGIWNYVQKFVPHGAKSLHNEEEEEEIYQQAFLQKMPMLDITNHTDATTKDKSENEKDKGKTSFSHKDDTMRDVLQAKIFRLYFETEVHPK